MSEDVKVLELRIDQDRLVDVLISDQMRRLGDLPGVTIAEPKTGFAAGVPAQETTTTSIAHIDSNMAVATVEVTQNGRGMDLISYSPHVLPEGIHALYAKPNDPHNPTPYFVFDRAQLGTLRNALETFLRLNRLDDSSSPKVGERIRHLLSIFELATKTMDAAENEI